MVRLIRSKGVGVYFVTQNPRDVPDDVLGQLGNRIQHALRAFTPRDQKNVRAAAQTFVPNPDLDTEQVITQLGLGEALVSTLGAKGVPGMVDQVLIAPPRSRMGPLKAAERKAVRARSPVGARYDETFDRESAFEKLAERAAAKPPAAPEKKAAKGKRRSDSVWQAALKSAARSLASTLGRSLARGLLGTLKGR